MCSLFAAINRQVSDADASVQFCIAVSLPMLLLLLLACLLSATRTVFSVSGTQLSLRQFRASNRNYADFVM